MVRQGHLILMLIPDEVICSVPKDGHMTLILFQSAFMQLVKYLKLHILSANSLQLKSAS